MAKKRYEIPPYYPSEAQGRKKDHWGHELYITDTIVVFDKLAEVFPDEIAIEELLHDRVLKRKPLGSQLGSFAPDILFELRIKQQLKTQTTLVECDRGTHRRVRLIEKFSRLMSWLSGMLRLPGDEPPSKILFVTSEGMQRVRMLVECCQQALASHWDGERLSQHFLFTSCTIRTPPAELGFAPVWYRPHASQPVPLLTRSV